MANIGLPNKYVIFDGAVPINGVFCNRFITFAAK